MSKTIDIKELYGYQFLEDSIYNISVRASKEGYAQSDPSEPVQYSKETGIPAGLYDDNDTLVRPWADLIAPGGPLYYEESQQQISSGSDTSTQIQGKLVIKNNVRYISDYTFQYCTGLTEVVIQEGIESIYYGAFQNCTNLETVTILGNTLNAVASGVFENCTSLETISISGILNHIQAMFGGCTNLQNITIPETVMVFDSLTNMADNNPQLKYYDENNNAYCKINDNPYYALTYFDNSNSQYELIVHSDCKMIADYTINSGSQLTSLILPEGLISIGMGSISNQENLSSLTLPSSLKYVGSYAITYLNSLTSIYIPSSVNLIEQSAFYNNINLVSIVIDPNNTTYDSRDNCNAIIETYSNKLMVGCTGTTIPNGIVTIGMNAFYNTNISSINIPDSVDTIETEAFAFNQNLQSLHIPQNVVTIGGSVCNGSSNLSTITVDSNNMFYDSRDNCNAIIEKSTNTLIQGCSGTTIPSTVNIIAQVAFANMSYVQNITIPSSVTKCDAQSFAGTNLQSITFESNGFLANGTVLEARTYDINSDQEIIEYIRSQGISWHSGTPYTITIDSPYLPVTVYDTTTWNAATVLVPGQEYSINVGTDGVHEITAIYVNGMFMYNYSYFTATQDTTIVVETTGGEPWISQAEMDSAIDIDQYINNPTTISLNEGDTIFRLNGKMDPYDYTVSFMQADDMSLLTCYWGYSTETAPAQTEFYEGSISVYPTNNDVYIKITSTESTTRLLTVVRNSHEPWITPEEMENAIDIDQYIDNPTTISLNEGDNIFRLGSKMDPYDYTVSFTQAEDMSYLYCDWGYGVDESANHSEGTEFYQNVYPTGKDVYIRITSTESTTRLLRVVHNLPEPWITPGEVESAVDITNYVDNPTQIMLNQGNNIFVVQGQHNTDLYMMSLYDLQDVSGVFLQIWCGLETDFYPDYSEGLDTVFVNTYLEDSPKYFRISTPQQITITCNITRSGA